MAEKKPSSRRNFLKQITGTSIAIAASPLASLAYEKKTEERILHYERKIAANDRINIAVIGMGIMGNNDTATSLKVPGVQLVAACDLYTGRLERAKEVHGKDLFTTNDYRKILEQKDICLLYTSDAADDL